MNAFGSPHRLAGVAGLGPVPEVSGQISGNVHRPRRYYRRLMPDFYMPAQAAARCGPTSNAFYARKTSRGEVPQACPHCPRTPPPERPVGTPARLSAPFESTRASALPALLESPTASHEP